MAGDGEKKPKAKANKSSGEAKRPKRNASGGQYCCQISLVINIYMDMDVH